MVEKDLGYSEIRDGFLKAIDEFHRSNDYTQDFRSLASKLDIQISTSWNSKEGNKFQYKDQRVILLEDSVAETRFRFTAWHELSHHLFDLSKWVELSLR